MRDMPTLQDVAREAGVSMATASRVLSGVLRPVGEVYRHRVLDAAARLNYVPNVPARTVARGLSSTLSLVVPDIADPFFSSIAAGVNRAAQAAGLVVTVAVTGRDAGREVEVVRSVRAERPRAIILAGSRFSEPHQNVDLYGDLAGYRGLGGRIVFIGESMSEHPEIRVPNREGARMLARAVTSLGYRHFAVLAGPRDLVTSRQRSEGFRRGLTEAGLHVPSDLVIHGDLSREGAQKAIAKLLPTRVHDIDLVFAVSDVMAIGAMTALHDMGLRTPHDVAVAGFDDIPSAVDVTPPMTTVRLPLEEVGVQAVRVALHEQEEPDEVPFEVRIRASTPPRR